MAENLNLGTPRLADIAAQIGWQDLTWSKERVIDAAGEVFVVLGSGASRVALLGPDGVVYKAGTYATTKRVVAETAHQVAPDHARVLDQLGPEAAAIAFGLAMTSTYQTEVAFFRSLGDAPWAPEFNGFDSARVTAMKRYDSLGATGELYDPAAFRLGNWLSANPQAHELLRYALADLKPDNFGVDRDSGQIVLIDAGQVLPRGFRGLCESELRAARETAAYSEARRMLAPRPSLGRALLGF